MSMSVNLHTKGNEIFDVQGYITTGTYEKDYVVIKIETREVKNGSTEDITIFPSYDQVKQMHKELSKLMRHIKAIEKANETEKALEELSLNEKA